MSLDAARELGVSEHDWRDGRLLRLTEGVRSLHAPVDLRERARAFALALPQDCAFSHVTAARLWGLPLPASLEQGTTLDVIRDAGRPRVERAGCRPHSGLERREVHLLDGLRVTSPADTWVDLGDVRTHRPVRDDLVVAGDALVTQWAPPGVRRTAEEVATALEPLRRTLEARGSPRGRRVLAQALDLVRPGVRSPRETRSRLLFVDAGFPEPEPCAPLHALGGGWLAEGDLVWRARRVVGEYQGDVHGSRAARSADAARNGLLGDEDWTVLEIFAEDHTDPHRRRAMLLRFARALGLDPAGLTIR